jgi:dUTP pyrophosphatase
MELKFKKLVPEAKLPAYATEGSACFDISSIQNVTIPVGERADILTGLAVEVPPGFVLLLFSRSGMGFKYGVRLANCVGVIDSDYRGELICCLQNDGFEDFRINAGNKIAQGMLVPIPMASMLQIVEAEELSATVRGSGGFGSTGA